MVNSYNKHIITLTQWLIIGLIIVLWIKFFLGGSNSTLTSINASSRNLSNQISQPPVDIAQYHIFGSAQQLYDVPLNTTTQSNLDLVLNGTMSNRDKSRGMAYISSVQGQQKKFKVGEKVFNLATLKEIHDSYVILSHNGRDERLSISENDISTVTSTRRKKASAVTATNPAFLKHLNGSQQRSWQEMVAQQKFDPGKISNIVSNINMVTDQSGSIKGLRVSNLSQSSALKKHGLKSNDIITAVNGNPINGKNMLSIKQTLMQNPNANITIKRNGKVQNITVNLSDI